jgi:hypothetical protein
MNQPTQELHLRMKSQGFARAFFEVAETLIQARGCARTAQRSHSARRAVHMVCTGLFVVPAGVSWRRGEHWRRGRAGRFGVE